MKGRLALILAAAFACTPKPREQCRRAFEVEDYARAASICAEVYARTGDVEAGTTAARAEGRLEHLEATIAWAERLGDDPKAAAAWRSAAFAEETLEHAERARAADVRASALYEQAGELGEAAYHAHRAMDADWHASRLLAALEQAERAFDLAWRSEDLEMRRVSFTSLFLTLHDAGDFESARALLAKTRAAVPDPDPAFLMFIRFYEALLHQSEGRVRLAAAGFRSALEAYRTLDRPRPDVRRAIRFDLVETLLALGDLDAAEAQLARAAAEAPEDLPSHMRSSQAYYGALVALARGRAEEAERILRPARDADPIPDWRWRLEHLLGRAMAAQGRNDEAAGAFSRSIEGVEALRAAMKYDDLKSTLLADKRAPYEALFALRLSEGHVDEALAISERARARAFLDVFLASRHDTRARLSVLESLAPRLTASPPEAPAPAPTPIGSTERALAGENVLDFFRAGDALYRYSHTAGGTAQIDRIPASIESISEQARKVEAGGRDLAPYLALGRTLLDGAALPTRRGATLYVVTDEPIANVPFAALRDRDRFLIERAAIAYVPSLTVLAALSGAARTSSAAAVVLGASRSFDPSRPELTGARDEAEAVAALLGVTARLGPRATRDALKAAGGAAVLHVAGHASAGAAGGTLELADGPVDAAAILAWHLHPKLVFLATCSSGTRDAHEISGTLATAFLAAGARTAVATLRAIPDASARRFAAAFYAAGGAGAPADAVASVARDWIRDGRPPDDWAPFVVFGRGE